MVREGYNPELEFTAFKNKNMMGNKFEKRMHSQFYRIFKLNNQDYENDEIAKVRLEIYRYLGVLRLQGKLEPYVFYNYSKFKDYFPKNSRNRGFKLIPIAIYLTCLTMGIFIIKKRIIANSDLTRTQFHSVLKDVLQYDKKLQEFIASDDFREKYILNVFNGISSHFKFPNGVIERAIDVIPLFIKRHRSMSNMNIIIGLYLFISHTYAGVKHIADKHIAEFLGVHQAMFTRMKKRLSNGKD